MVVIAHEREGMEDDGVFVDCVGEIGEKLCIIRPGEEDLPPLVTPGCDMIQGAGIGDTERSGHRCILRMGMRVACRTQCPMSMADPISSLTFPNVPNSSLFRGVYHCLRILCDINNGNSILLKGRFL